MDILKILEARIEERFSDGASKKERYFFNYLSGRKQEKEIDDDLTEIDKICYSAFSDSTISCHEVVKKKQKTVPLKGLHYTNNLIELVAMAKHDFEFEKKNVIKLAEKSSYKEKFIITYLFPSLSNISYGVVSTPIDRLIKHIFLDKMYDGISEKSISAVNYSSDLIELFIVKQAVLKALEIHPNHKVKEDLLTFIEAHKKLKFILSQNIRKQVKIAGAIFLTIIVLMILYVFIKFWDAWGLEPLLAALGIVSTIIFIYRSSFLSKERLGAEERIIKVIDSYVERRLQSKYYSFNVLKSNLDRIENEYFEN